MDAEGLRLRTEQQHGADPPRPTPTLGRAQHRETSALIGAFGPWYLETAQNNAYGA